MAELLASADIASKLIDNEKIVQLVSRTLSLKSEITSFERCVEECAEDMKRMQANLEDAKKRYEESRAILHKELSQNLSV
jgi:molecular chaperone GrpE (heat shock protein)